MELRDFFAAHVAAALSHRVERPDAIAERAYDLADALLRERRRRAPAPGAPLSFAWSVDEEPGSEDLADEDLFQRAGGLLDEPAPISERDEEIAAALADYDDDPRWQEPKWHSMVDAVQTELFSDPGADRPGLRRTTPPAAEKRRHQA
jgi:hypothetical protein